MNNIIGVRSQPVVSFCIPVYNNAEGAVKVVSNILVSDDERFEVVVCDDVSTDNAQELLAEIHDPRFRYYRNAKNLGAHQNWRHVLELGRGEWVYLVMGRDRLYGEKIGELIEYLNYAGRNGITCLRDGESMRPGIQVYSGMDAMIKFIGDRHPTGAIFSSKIFHSLENREKYFSISDMYPENYIWREMLLRGKGAFIMSGVFTSFGAIEEKGVVIDKAKVKSSVECGVGINKVFFAPERRTKQFYEVVNMIVDDIPDRFTEDELTRYLLAKFSRLLMRVSLLWGLWCHAPDAMAHYGLSTRKVSSLEMLRNIIKAYHDAADFLKSKGLMTRRRRLKMFWRAVFMSFFSPIAFTAHKVLLRLGIWHPARTLAIRLFMR